MDNLVWIVLLTAFFLAMLVLDLEVFHRRPHQISIREAAVWSGVWVALSCAFGVSLYFWKGAQSGVQFFTGYILEKSLSVDNLFLLAVIFDSLAIPPKQQHRTLFYGVLGAITLRAAFIAAGAALLARFSWVLSLFGVFLLVAGVRLLRRQRPTPDPQANLVVRWAHVSSLWSRSWRILLCPPQQAVVRHSAILGIGHGRSHRHGAGAGFHSRYLQRYAGAAHCVFVDHVRGPWFALVVLPPRRSHGETALPAYGLGSHIDLRGSKIAGWAFPPDSSGAFARSRLWVPPHRGIRIPPHCQA